LAERKQAGAVPASTLQLPGLAQGDRPFLVTDR
jgi:hypothetical protein